VAGAATWPDAPVAIHHLDEIGVVVRPANADLWIEAARISSTCSDSSMVSVPPRTGVDGVGEETFAGEIVACKDEVTAEHLLERGPRARRRVDVARAEQRQDGAETPSATKPLARQQGWALLEKIHDPGGVVARLGDRAAQDMFAVARPYHHAIGSASTIDLSRQSLTSRRHAEVRTDHREIGVTIADADVVVDEVVLGR